MNARFKAWVHGTSSESNQARGEYLKGWVPFDLASSSRICCPLGEPSGIMVRPPQDGQPLNLADRRHTE